MLTPPSTICFYHSGAIVSASEESRHFVRWFSNGVMRR
ncbi:hypothetical protein CKA32_001457 [Geitlerinema sp. FC II]|nr:hypothetical protein CKA32_001457 [Geitlerinema sp. FC II]